LTKRLANNEQYITYLRQEGVQIGNGCEIHKRAIIGSEPYLIKIGDNVRITRGVKFITHDGGMWTLRKMGLLENADLFGQIFIGDNTNIGWDVTILPGVSIGKNCVIGSGAIVTKNIPDNSVAAGVPAKVIETIEEYYFKNKERCVFTKSLSPEEKKKFLADIYSTG
jgi:acetyltransferase-like isoleucine patch superfamily enzyme